MITRVASSCDSCGGDNTYEYVASNFSIREPLVSKVKDTSGGVLASYQYDATDRVTSIYLGDAGTDLKASEVVYFDGGFLRRDYVNNTQYRASVYFTEGNGTITAERHYDNVQSGSYPSGKLYYTEYTKCSYTKDASNYLTKETTTLPRGNKKMNEYYRDENDRVTKRIDKLEDSASSITIGEECYDWWSSNVLPLSSHIEYSVNAAGGTTNYDYDASYDNLTRSISPDPGASPYSSGRTTTSYRYDGERRMTLDFRTAPGGTVSTSYVYDGAGNLATQIAAYGSGATAATTVYQYNEYNQITRVIDPEGNIRDTSYYGGGAVESESVKDPTGTYWISRTQYDYNDNGWLTKRSVLKEREPVSSLIGVSYVTDVYLYDSYGRVTQQIADAGGENLTSSYEYNNQSEVTEVTNPDTTIITTVRDGRGLVIQTINTFGPYSATTNFYYDANGNLTKEEDPEGICQIYQYDGFDRRIRSRRGSY